MLTNFGMDLSGHLQYYILSLWALLISSEGCRVGVFATVIADNQLNSAQTADSSSPSVDGGFNISWVLKVFIVLFVSDTVSLKDWSLKLGWGFILFRSQRVSLSLFASVPPRYLLLKDEPRISVSSYTELVWPSPAVSW